MHVHGLQHRILRERRSVTLRMSLYSSIAIHGHCQVQYTSLCVSAAGHDELRRATEIKVGQSWEKCREEEATEGRLRGNSWVKGQRVMGNELSTRLRFCLFFSHVSIVCVSWFSASTVSAKLRKDSCVAVRIERWSYRQKGDDRDPNRQTFEFDTVEPAEL